MKSRRYDLVMGVILAMALPLAAEIAEVPISRDSGHDWRGWYGNYLGSYLYTDPYTQSFFYADILSKIQKPGYTTTVNSAALKYYVYGSRFGSTPAFPYTVQAFRLSQDYPGLWTEGSSISDDPGSYDTTTIPPTYAEGYGTYTGETETGWFALDITDLVRAWANGTYNNYGIAITGTGGYLPQGIFSREYGDAGYHPYISVNFTLTPTGGETRNLLMAKDSAYEPLYRGWFSNYVGKHLYTDLYTKTYFYTDVIDWIKDPGHAMTIHRATLNYYVYGSRFGNSGIAFPYTLQAFRLTQDYPGSWSEGPVVGDNPSGWDLTTLPPQAAEGYGLWTGWTETGWFTLDITDLARAWADGTYANDGVMVTQTQGYLPQGIFSRESSVTAERPYFTIDYTIDRPRWENEVTPGHRILINKGLQIQAEAIPACSAPPGFTLSRFQESNFTGVNVEGNWADPAWAGNPPGIQWSRYGYSDYLYELQDSEIPYLPNMVSFQHQDEDDISNPAAVEQIKAWIAANRRRYPNVISYEDISSNTHTPDIIRNFVVTAKPDMLMFNIYPFTGTITGGSPTNFYSEMQKFRQIGLAGLDGAGNQPIPYALYLQSYVKSGHTASESEIRLNQFAAWAFGYKMVCAWFYNCPAWWGYSSILFTGSGDASPTPQFYQMASTNAMSKKLGPALVRLLSTDVRFIPGRHAVKILGVTIRTDDNNVPAEVTGGIDGADPYITGISAANLGGKNDTKRGDVIVGFYKPLHESFDGDTYTNERYFMITNGLCDPGGTAAETRQSIRIDFNFGSSGITALQRVNPSTGLAETVTLVPDGGSLYHLDLVLDGGTGDLFKYKTGAPFVGMTAAKIPGDANNDGKVDVSDLGILAANYGSTSDATWETGDFNDDDKVDVSDLGILAANYGAGTGATLDFNADARALGLATGADAIEPAGTQDVAVQTQGLCGAFGLSLIAGLFLAALTLSGLKVPS